MTDKDNLEEEVKSMKRHFGGLVSLVKDLKARLERLENVTEHDLNKEIKAIMEKQAVLEELIVANTERIKRIDCEVEEIRCKELVAQASKEINTKETNTTNDDLVKEVKIRKIGNKSLKRCRYFNRGHCKNKGECQFSHLSEICEKYLQEGICQEIPCQSRHPKVCKWTKTETGCRREDCDFLHVTLVGGDGKQTETHKIYPCMGCKNVYDDKVCVVQHIAENRAFFLCLNCDDWILRKDEILLPEWSLFDENGDLKQNVYNQQREDLMKK